jgi:anti-anti-sigma regulatory factor
MMPKGYINDLGAEQLEQTSEQFLIKGLKKLIVNFADVQFINTFGISIFTGMVKKTGARQHALFHEHKKIHLDIFEVVDLIKYVKVFRVR